MDALFFCRRASRENPARVRFTKHLAFFATHALGFAYVPQSDVSSLNGGKAQIFSPKARFPYAHRTHLQSAWVTPCKRVELARKRQASEFSPKARFPYGSRFAQMFSLIYKKRRTPSRVSFSFYAHFLYSDKAFNKRSIPSTDSCMSETTENTISLFFATSSEATR